MNYPEETFYFENREDEHNKFWAITIHINTDDQIYTLIRRWGKVGQHGRVMQETSHSLYYAESRKHKLITEKMAKGYKPVL